MKWECADCGVRVSWLPGFEVPEIPEGWTELNGSRYLCLICRRSRAVAKATDSEHPDPKARRLALVAFEHRRDPTRTAGQIAKLIGDTSYRVAKTRTALLAAGEIAPPPEPEPPEPKLVPPSEETIRRRLLREAVRAELKRHPDHADGWIAQRLGTNGATVRRHRVEMESSGDIPTVRQLVRSDGMTLTRKVPAA